MAGAVWGIGCTQYGDGTKADGTCGQVGGTPYSVGKQTMMQTLKGWGSVVRWGGQPIIIIVQTLKGWGSVTRWRGQPKGEDNRWFSFPLRNPPAFLSIAALIFHQSADWFVFVRGGFFVRTTRAGRGQSRKDWQRRRISEPSWKMRAMEQPVNRRGG